MRALLPFGWLLVAAALLGAAAETAARLAHGGGLILSAHDVWYALAPGSLVVAKIRLEALLGPWAWDPLATTMLALPVWLLFGGPGAVLLWLGWRRRGPADPADGREEEALFLFDALADQAEAEARADPRIPVSNSVDARVHDHVAGSQALARSLIEGKEGTGVEEILAERRREAERE